MCAREEKGKTREKEAENVARLENGLFVARVDKMSDSLPASGANLRDQSIVKANSSEYER